MNRIRKQISDSKGFTIIELLIATLIFALILILITVSVLTFTKSYYRGVNQSNTQNVARTVIENISQSIQFSGDLVNPVVTPNNGSQGFCVGNKLYSYALGWQLVEGTVSTDLSQSPHALMLSAASSCNGATAQDVRTANPDGTELLTPKMRLAKLKIEPMGGASVWRITVRVVFGDDDLLCSPSTQGSCQSSNTTSPFGKEDLSCKVAFSGSQYCAMSELSTVVKKRVTSAQ